MKKTLATAAIVFAVLAAYLLLWPVPIEPVAWQAPVDRGYIDPFARNELLRTATGIDIGEYEGPEDATVGKDNRLYITTADGTIIRLRGRAVTELANPGGRPLGIETAADGSLIVANSYSGLQRISMDGTVTTLLDTVDGEPLVYANNLGIGPDGKIYFSQSSTKFGAESYRGTYEASLLDILEHGGHGRVLEFDPLSGDVRTLLSGLNFANGVAVSTAGDFLIVAETGSYRILKYWLNGEKAGTHEVLLQNLPGFPDNIKSGLNGRFWIGIAAPRDAMLDAMSDKPLLRKIVQRLPSFMRPKAKESSHVIAINGNGEVLMNMHDPRARFATMTGVVETRNSLFLTTLFGHQLARIAKGDLGN
ncbi:MAG: SMP-30/gluconolactonase/LRE family protein [Gammaproteobacteria bacterium]|nr:SMP-30/gluconolactonase/LRE family protein [Gammaproteobacteria bacterium]